MSFDVAVMGSINLDVKVLVEQYPNYAETSSAKSIEMLPGGKGSNQAVAIAKLGGNVAFVGAVGDDSAGKQMIDNLEKQNVDTTNIYRSTEEGTGTFVIMLDDKGENTMVGTLGANNTLKKEEVETVIESIDVPVLLLQMETSKESIDGALSKAKEKGMFIILDPAPANGYFEEALSYADCVTPNQQETEKITGIKVTNKEEALEAAKIISEKGAKSVIIKMGSNGNLIYKEGQTTFVEAHKVKAVDTVGAGDTFAGALALHYSKNENLVEAVKFANAAAAVKVSRLGGHEATPTIEEVEDKLGVK